MVSGANRSRFANLRFHSGLLGLKSFGADISPAEICRLIFRFCAKSPCTSASAPVRPSTFNPPGFGWITAHPSLA